jgi:hypothetical protein
MHADMPVTATCHEPAQRFFDVQLGNLRIQAKNHLARKHPSTGSDNPQSTQEDMSYLWEYGCTKTYKGTLFWRCKFCKDDGSRCTTFCAVRTALTCFLEIVITADQNALVLAVLEHLQVCEAEDSGGGSGR